MIELANGLTIEDNSVSFTAMRAGGAGGQHVNTTDSAVQLRFDIEGSGLPESAKRRLRALDDRRVTADGVIVLKAQRHRSQARNKEDAIARLVALLSNALRQRKPRRATRPSRAAHQRRIDDKTRRSKTKSLRRPPET